MSEAPKLWPASCERLGALDSGLVAGSDYMTGSTGSTPYSVEVWARGATGGELTISSVQGAAAGFGTELPVSRQEFRAMKSELAELKELVGQMAAQGDADFSKWTTAFDARQERIESSLAAIQVRREQAAALRAALAKRSDAEVARELLDDA